MKRLLSFDLTFLFILLIVSTGCEKEPEAIHTVLSGKLVAANSNEYLPNAKIKLVRITYRGYVSVDVVLDSTITDAFGNYSFDFTVPYAHRYAAFQLISEYPNYYSTRDWRYGNNCNEFGNPSCAWNRGHAII